MVGVQGPQTPGGWGAPATPPAGAAAPGPATSGGSGEKLLIGLASLVSVAALIGGSVFVVGQRGDDGGDGPTPTQPTDPTDPTDSTDTTEPAALPPPDSYDGYTTLVDDEGLISVDMPDEWTDVNTSGFTVADDETTPGLRATTDTDAFLEGYGTSGGEVAIYGATTLDSLSSLYDDECKSDTPAEAVTTGDGLTGESILYSECTGADGEEAPGFAYAAAFDLENGDTVWVTVIIAVEADYEAVAEILDTLVISE